MYECMCVVFTGGQSSNPLMSVHECINFSLQKRGKKKPKVIMKAKNMVAFSLIGRFKMIKNISHLEL